MALEAEWAQQHLEIEKTSYTAEEFYEWFRAGRLRLSPDFQRGEVWKRNAKAFLIDTMLRGFPIPPLHIRLVSEPDAGLVREVIDGQQRLTAVIQYLEGRFSLTTHQGAPGAPPPWAGLKFRGLTPDLQRRILDYSFRCEVYKGQIDDLLIREIFSRINMYSVPLNDQEIRNGKYFGEFKQAVYSLAREHEEFWLAAGIFTQTAIARMLDARLVSEVLVAEIAGQQDKKTTLDTYYNRYEEKWPERDLYVERFRGTMDDIRSAVGEILRDTDFRRAPLFYTLFVVVYHRRYGMEQRLPENEPGMPPSPLAPLSDAACRRLADAAAFLTDVLSDEVSDPAYSEFRRASSRQTDNIRPRLARFRVLWDEAALSSE
jgi:hypothetical protein